MFPQRWMPASIAVLAEPFTEENHMVNSTMKIVRGKITEHYKNRIEYLYKPESKDICNEHNMDAVMKILAD